MPLEMKINNKYDWEQPPQKPTNLRPCEGDLVIDVQHFTKLEISPYYRSI